MQIVSLPYQPQLSNLLSGSQPAWTILLDSTYPAGRYDIFVTHPMTTLVTRSHVTEIHTHGQPITSSKADPFELIKQYLGDPIPTDETLPFIGGAVGYFGYDLARRIETLPVIASPDIPLPEMAIGIYDFAIIVDHVEKTTCIVSQNRDPHSAEMIRQLQNQLATALPHPDDPIFHRHAHPASNMDYETYHRAFNQIQKHLRAGDCYEVNFAQRWQVKTQGSPLSLYRALREKNPAPFSAFMDFPFAKILSCSPERFLKVNHKNVITQPIKGTRPRGKTPELDEQLAFSLLQSEKDRAENLMIVDLMRNDLSKNCYPESVEVPELFALHSFKSVHHLISTVTASLSPDKHSLDLLKGCFPGGSITGAPKIRVMEIIESLDPHRRALYCGSIGYIGFDGNMDVNIAIRTLIHCQDTLSLYAGGAIVIDSHAEAEYQETQDKLAVIMNTLMQF